MSLKDDECCCAGPMMFTAVVTLVLGAFLGGWTVFWLVSADLGAMNRNIAIILDRLPRAQQSQQQVPNGHLDELRKEILRENLEGSDP